MSEDDAVVAAVGVMPGDNGAAVEDPEDVLGTVLSMLNDSMEGLGTSGNWKARIERLEPTQHVPPGYSTPVPVAGPVLIIENDESKLDPMLIQKQVGGGYFEIKMYGPRKTKAGKVMHGMITRRRFRLPGDPKVTPDMLQRNPDQFTTGPSAISREESSIARDAMKDSSEQSRIMQRQLFETQEKLRSAEAEKARLEARMESFERTMERLEEDRNKSGDRELSVVALIQQSQAKATEQMQASMQAQLESMKAQLERKDRAEASSIANAMEPMKIVMQSLQASAAQEAAAQASRTEAMLKIMSNSHASQLAVAKEQSAMQLKTMEAQLEAERRYQEKRESDLIERMKSLEERKDRPMVERIEEMTRVVAALKSLGGGDSDSAEESVWDKLLEVAPTVAPHVPGLVQGLMSGAGALIHGTSPALPAMPPPPPPEQLAAMQAQAEAEQEAQVEAQERAAEVERVIGLIVQGRQKDTPPATLAGSIISLVGMAAVTEILQRPLEQIVEGLAMAKPELGSVAGKGYVRDVYRALQEIAAGD